jgi:hypothetical protein
MAAALIGNIMNSNIRTNISATTATGITSGSSQVLASNILANPTLGSGNYTYQWSYTGTAITFTASQSNSTNCTYGSLSVSGSTTIYCTVSDNWTGVKTVTANCVITWPVQSIPITAVTWSIGSNTNSTYSGSAQSVTVVSVTPSGATYSTSTTTATNVGQAASTTITGTGSYTGSFTSPSLTIVAATLTGTAQNVSLVYNGSQQSGTVIINVNGTYTGSVDAVGTSVGSSYTSSISGTGNYTGTVNGGTLSITAITITAMSFTLNGAAFTSNQTVSAGTNYTIAVGSTTPSGATYAPLTQSGSTAGSYQLAPSGTGNYQGGPFDSPILTITGSVSPTGSITVLQATVSNQQPLQANLSGASATGYSWSKVSGIIISLTNSTSQVATVVSNNSGSVTLQCVISYAGGTVTPQVTISMPAPT